MTILQLISTYHPWRSRWHRAKVGAATVMKTTARTGTRTLQIILPSKMYPVNICRPEQGHEPPTKSLSSTNFFKIWLPDQGTTHYLISLQTVGYPERIKETLIFSPNRL